MKMVKKVLMGLALGAVVLSFAGCGNLAGTTDKAGIIKGSVSNYSVDYANDTGAAVRDYKETAMKHAGGLIKVTFDSTENLDTSKMGVIFDLKTDKTGAREFFIIGLSPVKGKNNFYVSKFSNVTNIQEANFGTALTENPAKEKEIVPLKQSDKIATTEKGPVSYYIYYKTLRNGSIDYAVLKDLTDEEINQFKGDAKFEAVEISSFADRVLESGNISATDTGYEADTETPTATYYNDKQNKLAFYVQVAKDASLSGSWNVPSTTFHEAEDAE